MRLIDQENIILIKRRYAPFKGKYALPGGFINYNEDPKQAVVREVREETHLVVEVIDKIGTYDQEGRDPREKRVESKAFKCRIVKDLSKLKGGDDTTVAEAISVNEIKNFVENLNLNFKLIKCTEVELNGNNEFLFHKIK